MNGLTTSKKSRNEDRVRDKSSDDSNSRTLAGVDEGAWTQPCFDVVGPFVPSSSSATSDIIKSQTKVYFRIAQQGWLEVDWRHT